MKPPKFFVQGHYSTTYRIYCGYEAPVLGPIKPQDLSSENEAHGFIIRLRLDHAFCSRILRAVDGLTVNSDISARPCQNIMGMVPPDPFLSAQLLRLRFRQYPQQSLPDHPASTRHSIPGNGLPLRPCHHSVNERPQPRRRDILRACRMATGLRISRQPCPDRRTTGDDD